jgi:hypothetical protein
MPRNVRWPSCFKTRRFMLVVVGLLLIIAACGRSWHHSDSLVWETPYKRGLTSDRWETSLHQLIISLHYEHRHWIDHNASPPPCRGIFFQTIIPPAGQFCCITMANISSPTWWEPAPSPFQNILFLDGYCGDAGREGVSEWAVMVDFSLLFPATLLVAIWFWPFVTARVRAFRRSRIASTGRCHNCGYDLRATPVRCPECGVCVGASNRAILNKMRRGET